MEEETTPLPEPLSETVAKVPSTPKVAPAAKRPAYNPNNSNLNSVQFLNKLRGPLVELQEARGFSRTEEYSFINLLKALYQHTYNAAVNICTMIYNLLPLFDGFLYFLRFVIDKLIDICETSDFQEKIVKGIILTGELLILFILLFFISSVLIFPIIGLGFHFIRKILNVALGR